MADSDQAVPPWYPAATLAQLEAREAEMKANERAALEALGRAQPMSTTGGEPVVSHGWVTVYLRPGDWKALCMWRDDNTPKAPDPATCKHDWILVPPGDDHCTKCGAYR